MVQINPFRMLGRIEYSLDYLMRKYNLSFNGQTPSWYDLLMSLSTQVSPRDQQFCIQMANASNTFVEEAQTANYDSATIDAEKLKGKEEATFIFQKYPHDYQNKLLERRDFLAEKSEDIRKKKAQVTRNWLIVAGIVAVVALCIVIYNLPYFAEGRQYQRVIDAYESGDSWDTDWETTKYINEYPDGKHLSDVLYYSVKSPYENEDVPAALDAIDRYLDLDPNGQYVSEVRKISSEIWQSEIDRYKNLAESSSTKDGADYMIRLLEFMRDHYTHTIYVEAFPSLNLKEYSDYPYSTRQMLETYYNDPSEGVLPKDMVQMKDYINKEEAANWVSYFVSSLQEGFDRIFTPGVINVVEINEYNRDEIDQSSSPVVKVNYTISSQEFENNIPHIWMFAEQSAIGYNQNIILFIGITMKMNAAFSIPGWKEVLDIAGSGDAGSGEIRNLQESEIYARLGGHCLKEFGDKVRNDLGLSAFLPDEAAATDSVAVDDDYYYSY